jgi:hypothetical protein
MVRLLGSVLALVAVNASAATVTAVEYYHAVFDHYFMSAFPAEQAVLDAGTTIKGWTRTGKSFAVNDASGTPVCRFFSTSFAPKSSHFYTALASECAAVKANANWQYEAISFYVNATTADGLCGTSKPVYRLYNNGQGGAPNHRYTTDTTVRAQMIAKGWIAEGYGIGVAFCEAGASAPTDVAYAKLTQLVGGTWFMSYYFGKAYTDAHKWTKIEANTGSDPINVPYNVLGMNQRGATIAANYSYATKDILAISPLGSSWDIYVYDFTSTNAVSGCYYFDYGQSNPFAFCTALTGSRIGATLDATPTDAFAEAMSKRQAGSAFALKMSGDDLSDRVGSLRKVLHAR